MAASLKVDLGELSLRALRAHHLLRSAVPSLAVEEIDDLATVAHLVADRHLGELSADQRRHVLRMLDLLDRLRIEAAAVVAEAERQRSTPT